MTWDALVVGAGIAGLVAATRLQQAGHRTVVIEKAKRAGGLCGTFEEDGFEFAIGCNDFGKGFERMVADLGVDISFHHPRARFHFGAHRMELPPDAGTFARLLLRGPSIAAAIWKAKGVETVGELVDHHISDPLLADLVCLYAYAMMRSPDDVPLSLLKADFSRDLAYGHETSCTPIGGPRVLIDRMVARFTDLGGKLMLEHTCNSIERSGPHHIVRTQRDELRARAVLSSEGRWPEYGDPKPGLDVALVLLVVDATCPFPAGYHTLDWFAGGVGGMLRTLDAGEPVAEPSFHSVRSDLAERDGQYSLTVFVPMARGEDNPSPARRQELVEHVRRRLAQLLPGSSRALRRATLLAPAEYEARFGFRPRPSVRVLPIGASKLPSYDAKRAIHYLGTSVNPPGEHASAAALSGWRAAGAVIEARRSTDNTLASSLTERECSHVE